MLSRREHNAAGADQRAPLDPAAVGHRAVLAVMAGAGASSPDSVALSDLAASPQARSAKLHTATLTIAGASRPVVVKEVGAGGMFPAARALRTPGVLDACREAFVYRDVLGPIPGPPQLLGHQLDADGRAGVLVLERVGGVQLDRVDDLAVWTDALRWLGRFHATPTARPTPSSVLQSYERRRFAAWAGRARRVGRARGTSRRDLDRVVEVFERIGIELVCRAPTTFVHGELYPSEVVVGAARADGTIDAQRRRIALLDWETAGIGPALLDVASLLTGSWSGDQRGQLLEAYSSIAPGAGGEHFDATFAACRLALALRWMGWLAEQSPADGQTHDWMAEAEDACRYVL